MRYRVQVFARGQSGPLLDTVLEASDAAQARERAVPNALFLAEYPIQPGDRIEVEPA